MKKIYFTAMLAMAFLCTLNTTAQKFDQLDKSPTDITYLRHKNQQQPLVKVVYSRPQKQEASVFGEQIPFGEIWQTGANEATEVKFYSAVKFGDKVVKPGTYVMHSIPGEKEWTIILNSNTDTWGAFFYNPEKDVVRIKVPVKEAENIDVFSIAFNRGLKNVSMVLAWDTTRVNIPIEMGNELLANL